MRTLFALSLTIAAASLAAPAWAQQRSTAGLDAPTPSETPQAQREWYRQFTESQPATAQPKWQTEPTQDLSIEFGSSDRWKFNFDKVTRPAESPLPREQMQAGASFRLTPRLSVGGEVSIGADELDGSLDEAARWDNGEVEAGIRLKSAFKF